MSIINRTADNTFCYRVVEARSLVARLTGLLGTNEPVSGAALHIIPCKGVHTFGMKYPIDVLFLDSHGKVLKTIQDLAPNRTTKSISKARSVLEFNAGTIRNLEVKEGDILEIETDEQFQPDLDGFKRIFHWPVNIFIALLWSLFVVSSFLHWQQNGHILSLGLVIVNTLLFGLFLTRRESTEISHRMLDWLIPTLTVILSLSLRPHPSEDSVLVIVSTSVQFFGVCGMIISLMCLGRSFGIVPANRGLKRLGLYRIVRHPVYTSEIIFYIGFVMGNMTPLNLSMVLIIIAGQVYRVLSEETLLSRENTYREYMRSVKYRLLPGVY